MIKNESDFKKIVDRLEIDTQPSDAHRENLRRRMFSVFNEAQSSSTRTDTWQILGRTIMRNPISKLAAAAVIIVAILIGVHYFGGPIDGAGVAWAKVSQRILDADTAIFNVTLGEAPPIKHIAGEKLLRQKLPGGFDNIIDYEQGKVLTLNSKNKTAMFVQIDGFPEAPPNFFERLKTGIEKLKNAPDVVVESLGTIEINGINATGIRVYSGKSIDMTIWSEPQTNLPILIIIDNYMGQTNVVFSDFDFDAEIDESLFSMEIPQGYSQQEQVQMDLANPTEQDLADGLRSWAEMTDGTFPPKLDLGIMQRQGSMFDKKFAEMNASDAEEIKTMEKIIRGLMFVQKVKGHWNYAGNGVKLGDADAPIFWYRPKDSETYRVIYGDLTVEDVAPEDLPE